MTQGIYKIHNTVSKKSYIGLSINIEQRFHEHKSCLRRDVHINKHLQNSYNKHGEDVFQFLILEEVENEDELLIREAFHASYHKDVLKEKLFNIVETGQPTPNLPGCSNPNSSLSEEEVKEIRLIKSLNPNITYKRIAKKYNISADTVSRIYRRISYKNI